LLFSDVLVSFGVFAGHQEKNGNFQVKIHKKLEIQNCLEVDRSNLKSIDRKLPEVDRSIIKSIDQIYAELEFQKP
jgi:hypothetical protein